MKKLSHKPKSARRPRYFKGSTGGARPARTSHLADNFENLETLWGQITGPDVLGKLTVDELCALGYKLTEIAPPPTAVVCRPWCVVGDGHPNEICAEDQHCTGRDRRISLSLHHPANPDFEVSPWRDHNESVGHVLVYYSDERRDLEVKLTPAEARQYAADILEVADELEANG